MAGGGLEFGAAVQQHLELGLLVFGQGIRMGGEPAHGPFSLVVAGVEFEPT
jgi:hypothetical protein